MIGTAFALRRCRKAWLPAQLGGTQVLLAEELGPAVIGWRRFTTVIPRWALMFDEQSRALMLEHEAEHARSGDPYLHSVALLALIAMPWNPAIWWAMRRMRLAVEIDCDGRLLRRGVDPHFYASLLLAVGERMSATPFAWATAFGGSRSTREKRIVARTTPLRPKHLRLAIAGMGAVALAVIAIACAFPVPDPVVSSAVSKVASNDPAWAPDGKGHMAPLADTLFYYCTGSDCPNPGKRDTTISYRRKAPKDTVQLNFDRTIDPSINMALVCEIHSDCHGFVGEGRRNDTLFVYRTNNFTFHTSWPETSVQMIWKW